MLAKSADTSYAMELTQGSVHTEIDNFVIFLMPPNIYDGKVNNSLVQKHVFKIAQL